MCEVISEENWERKKDMVDGWYGCVTKQQGCKTESNAAKNKETRRKTE